MSPSSATSLTTSRYGPFWWRYYTVLSIYSLGLTYPLWIAEHVHGGSGSSFVETVLCCSPCLIAFDLGSFRWTTCPWWLWCILCTTVFWGWLSLMPCWTWRRSVCLLSFGCHRSGVCHLLSIFGNSMLRDEGPLHYFQTMCKVAQTKKLWMCRFHFFSDQIQVLIWVLNTISLKTYFITMVRAHSKFVILFLYRRYVRMRVIIRDIVYEMCQTHSVKL